MSVDSFHLCFIVRNGMNLLVYLLQESLENEDLLDDMISLMSAMNNAALINTDTYIDVSTSTDPSC